MTEPVREVVIVYAGYGYLNQTIDVTKGIRTEYQEGARTFLATNRFGDPASGKNKALYVVWEYVPPITPGARYSGVSYEHEKVGFKID
ncbi:hypothetical protein [Burkholderia stabilis]|uniref:Uncharacterized protein n=1 Tax=Burkholderia stabilis TaxID=95485 RepID=A0AAJ5N3L9_9BURK|nr:hypothetical protein [Burkholderia stabilis]VBB10591.1 hypothetical protein BSTAB16_0698 [Burkholderia stabilis]HDR9491858.1 hypothetical protein [Burkholderia stabilis]HDR9524136.1 hypothetical protein [Burkholderia stabilis]HDR9531006.1 hypothetical protein [Burkholderia stabilis]HDR9538546.1 hypothetical protein [Burkholderia stabilis]